MIWDLTVVVCAYVTLVFSAMNVLGGIWLVAEGKKTPGAYIVGVVLAACGTVVSGFVLGWW